MEKSHGTVVGDNKSSTHLLHMGSCHGGQEPCVWSSPGGGFEIDLGKRIFCNRSLNMKNIVAVGFDMDYTLAQYKPETFESLAYEGTVRKLVFDLGYPREVYLSFCFLICSFPLMKKLMLLLCHMYNFYGFNSQVTQPLLRS